MSLLIEQHAILDSLDTSEARQFSKEYLYLWHKNFILDIVATSQECPENYEELYMYKWPGTMVGCGCPYTINNQLHYYVVKGNCTKKLQEASCFAIEE